MLRLNRYLQLLGVWKLDAQSQSIADDCILDHLALPRTSLLDSSSGDIVLFLVQHVLRGVRPF